MPRSEEAEWWFNAVYEAIQQVPPGKVTSYGHIARLLGRADKPRQVGVCLKQLPQDTSQYFNESNVPWQRVVNAQGRISPRGPGSTQRQAVALRREHVAVRQDAMGVYSVDLSRFGWFPDTLPNEESAEDSASEDDDDDDDAEVKSEEPEIKTEEREIKSEEPDIKLESDTERYDHGNASNTTRGARRSRTRNRGI